MKTCRVADTRAKTFFTQPRITVYKNTWRVRQNTVRLVQSQGPRVLLAPNLQYGRQNPFNPGARKSTDHQSEQSVKNRDTCRGNVDYRIPGIPHSAVQKEDSNRKETVKRPIQKFDNNPNRDSLTEDLNKTEEFNPSSEVEGVDHQPGEHGILRAVRDLF